MVEQNTISVNMVEQNTISVNMVEQNTISVTLTAGKDSWSRSTQSNIEPCKNIWVRMTHL
jgi:hypothetical protein